MKPFDTKGEYTPEEVKAALAGVNGTRQLSYRYERLNSKNEYIEDIDFIQSCTIENNALADIKRTAKFDVLDTGSINYLKDRIKPYVRLAMPEEKTYKDAVRELNPAVWWSLDDPATAIDSVVYTFPDDNSISTVSTAYDISARTGTGIMPAVQVGSATLRSEGWFKDTSKSSQAFEITAKAAAEAGFSYEIYTSPDSVGDQLTLLYSGTLAAGQSKTYRVLFPYNGWMFARLVATSMTKSSPYISFTPATRLEDSAGRTYAMSGMIKSANKVTGLITDGGSAVYANTSYTYWSTADNMTPISITDTGLSLNFWVKSNLSTSTQTSYAGIQGTFEDGNTYAVTYRRELGKQVLIQFLFGDVIPNQNFNIPESVFTNTTHMLTYTLDFATKKIKFFVDGVERVDATPDNFSDVVQYMEGKKVTYLYGGLNTQIQAGGTSGPTTVDDVSIYRSALSRSNLDTLYSMGTSSSGNKRSGYVEWPQGVFVLSSPSRKMVDGNTVVREVEGYDQLVSLKEDSFDYRFAVAQGATYTQAIKDVLQSSELRTPVKLTDKVFRLNGVGTTVTSDTTAQGIPYNWSAISTDMIYSIVDFSISTAVSCTTGPSFILQVGIRSAKTDYFLEIFLNTVRVSITNQPVVDLGTYSATTHKYLRVRQSAGIIYFETSADGTSWQTQYTYQSTTFAGEGVQPFILARDSTNSTAMIYYSDFKMSALSNITADIESNTKTLPAAMEWETGTSKLDIVNDLLAAINYTSAVYNEDGVFTSKAYISPQIRASQFRYATDSSSVLVGDVDQTVDMFGIPNKWVLVVSDPDKPALTGTYVNSDPMSPTSTVSRGRTITDFRVEQDAADQATLDAKAARLAFEASQVYEVIEFNTALMPIHQDSDVYEIIIDGLAVNNKYSEHSWSMDLKNGSVMRHRARRVVSV